MKKLFFLGFIFLTLNVAAQDGDTTESTKGFDPTDLFVGGSITLSLGGYSGGFIAGLNPHFGYTIAKWLDVAAVVNYQYNSFRDGANNKFRSTIVGGGVFTR